MAASAREEELESTWRQRLARFATSGLKVKAFCRQEAVSEWSFYHWRRRLRRPAEAAAADTGPATFVDLGTMAADACSDLSTPTGVASLTIRLDLPGGITLTVSRS
jgi:hypothetical protein